MKAGAIPWAPGKLALTLIVLALAPFSAYGTDLSPVGLWKTVDDHTGKPRGLVRVTQVGQEYQAKVEKIFPSPAKTRTPGAKNVKERGMVSR